MATRAALQQEIADAEQAIVGLRKEVEEIRRYISSNEHAMQAQPESLRAITQESLAKARANLARKEGELQAAQTSISSSRQVLAKLDELERKQQEIAKLERDLETITNLLEKARSDFGRIEGEYLTLTGPVTLPQFTLLLGDGQAIALPTDRADITVGLTDQADRIFPDLDLAPHGGKTSGVSRRHAQLRYQGNQWTVTDLGSSNGTFVNEVALQPGVPFVIQDGSRLRFGGLNCTLRSAAPTKTVRL
jgi:pSer/pThr/pTyr-binding forkhead associated (FHA) protein